MAKAICKVEGCERQSHATQLCGLHYHRLARIGSVHLPSKLTVEQRFWSKVNRGGPISSERPDLGQCWVWTKGVTAQGYASIGFGPRSDRKVVLAHRFAYEMLVGPVPDGLELDHLCRVRRCVRPEHLEPVSHRTNVLRGIAPTAVNAARTHCSNGHLFDAANTYIYPSTGGRGCRTCNRDRSRARWRKDNWWEAEVG